MPAIHREDSENRAGLVGVRSRGECRERTSRLALSQTCDGKCEALLHSPHRHAQLPGDFVGVEWTSAVEPEVETNDQPVTFAQSRECLCDCAANRGAFGRGISRMAFSRDRLGEWRCRIVVHRRIE